MTFFEHSMPEAENVDIRSTEEFLHCGVAVIEVTIIVNSLNSGRQGPHVILDSPKEVDETGGTLGGQGSARMHRKQWAYLRQ